MAKLDTIQVKDINDNDLIINEIDFDPVYHIVDEVKEVLEQHLEHLSELCVTNKIKHNIDLAKIKTKKDVIDSIKKLMALLQG